ncbi:flagellar protein FlgJ [Sphaerotilus hippei]|uniref:Peptidoglycan hydrolase FlgJ n=1 Tax=Sphaerotilus hippei TaxID=744406 RepID=A0A318GYG7_9BURK|nr:flagellar assembly peptidoglycan hydrolase FlgJ [Sphaerotilus hippei]PXW93709.1 flagellar protein FlgJ [Sphaerotilus hippei]
MRTESSSSQQQLAASSTALNGLRASAQRDPKGAIKEAAKQFEALFMQELMKSMRSSSMSSGMLDNSGTEMATGMLDQQYATQLSGGRGGLSEAIVRQLERQMGGATTEAAAGSASLSSSRDLRAAAATRQAAAAAAAPAVTPAATVPASSGGTAQTFVNRHGAAAAAAEASSGIPAKFMLAQAAHETGWGRREIKGQDGTNSNNLFGIKAGAGWNGPTVTVTTTEYINGQAQKVQARFRAYSSPEESFQDYARMISSSPRYAKVMESTGDAQGFARGLQRAGYATDPEYAQKLGRVMQTTERLQRAAASVQTARNLTT